ncbi:MAG: hypothetical protein ABIV11_08295 [Gemmatimonadaceae bacterium]
MTAGPPQPDPRVGLRAGLHDAGVAVWNMNLLSTTAAPEDFRHGNTDLAFVGDYVIQGNWFKGFQIWDIGNPRAPSLLTAFVCPGSQNDVSVYGNLLFVSTESLAARTDCGTQGVRDTVSSERLRGIRIFDISDIAHPKQVAAVQTCRGSHTHSVLVDPKDTENVYVYVSAASLPRSPSELAGCARTDLHSSAVPFRIEIIKVPLANPSLAAIVSAPRILSDLAVAPYHGEAPEDVAEGARLAAAARARGGFTATIWAVERVMPPQWTTPLLDSIMKARGGMGSPTAADSATLRASIQGIMDRRFQFVRTGPTACHDITLYPAIGLAGGACYGYGLLLDIRDPANPVRLTAVADTNFANWHSATFNNDGTKVLFSDEWGGGGSPKCRATDRREWGANALFATDGRSMELRSYYKLPVAQTVLENCVSHNGSLIPIPGRDVMVQSWYQGGVSVFDWTDAARPREIAFFDRGPVDSARMLMSGSWSAYWYNGVIVSSEMSRGLDILELTPSAFLTQNEIDAAKSVRFDYYNVQGQQKFVWPPSFALARAYLDQLERSRALGGRTISRFRDVLARAHSSSGARREHALLQLADEVDAHGIRSSFAGETSRLAAAIRDLARSGS